MDLDGVVYDFVDAYRQLVIGAEDSNDCPEPTRWEFYLDWNIPLGTFLNDLKIYDSIFRDGKSYPGAEKALVRLLDAGHTLVFITDRSINPRAEQITRDWISTRLPDVDMFNYELYITADKASIQVDYFIDDKPENVDAVAITASFSRPSSKPVSVLLDRPWNQESKAPRVQSLAEFVERVIERERSLVKNLTDFRTVSLDEVRVTSSTGGQKGKKLARHDLIPPRAMTKVAEVYGKGALKYADWNWRKGYDWSLSLAALERHLNAFKDGESTHEDGHHLGSVVFHALALMTFEEEHPELDDRFKRPA